MERFTGASKSLSQKIASNILDVSLGSSFAGYTDISGRLYTWGSNDKGQLGNSKSASKPTPVNVTSGVLTSAYKYITGLKLEKTTLSLAPDATETLKVTVEPSDARDKSYMENQAIPLSHRSQTHCKSNQKERRQLRISAGSVRRSARLRLSFLLRQSRQYTEKNIKVGKSFLLAHRRTSTQGKVAKYFIVDLPSNVTTYGKVVGKSAVSVVTVTRT